MAFRIICDSCGQEQVLTKEKMYGTEEISILVDPYTTDHWDSVSIECNNADCENYI